MHVPSAEKDKHYLESLIEQGDWKALIRYWLAHVLEPEGLDCAIKILSEPARSSTELGLADYFSSIQNVPASSWHPPDDALLATCNEDELVTVALVYLIPTVFQCHAALRGHVAMRKEREEALRQGLEAAVQCLKVAENINDSALQQLYNDYIAAALWKLSHPSEALAPMLVATDLARNLRKDEPFYYGEALIGSLSNLVILYQELNMPDEEAACYREIAGVCLGLSDHGQEKLIQAASALYKLGKLLKNQSELEEAYISFKEALSIYLRQDIEVPHADVSNAHYFAGETAARLKKFDAAKYHFQEAITVARQGEDVECKEYLASALNGLALLQGDFGDFTAAHQSYLEALGLWRGLSEIDPDRYGYNLSVTLANISLAEEKINKSNQADYNGLFESQEIERGLKRQAEATHADVEKDIEVLGWTTAARRYFVLRKTKYLDEAISLVNDDDIRAILQHPNFTLGRIPVELVQPALDRLRSQSKLSEYVIVACIASLSELDKANLTEFAPIAAVQGIDSNDLLGMAISCEKFSFFECAAFTFYVLGKYHDMRGELQKAKALLNRSLNCCDQIPSSEKELYADMNSDIKNSLGVILRELREFNQAELFFNEVSEYREKVWKKLNTQNERLRYARTLINLGTVYVDTRYDSIGLEETKYILDEADKHYSALEQEGYDWSSIAVEAARCLNSLGNVLRKMNLLDEAAEKLHRAVEILRQVHSEQNAFLSNPSFESSFNSFQQPDLFITLLNYGRLLHEQKKYHDAKKVFIECIELHRKMPAKQQDSLRINYCGLLNSYAKLLAEMGDEAQALEIHSAAIQEAEKTTEHKEQFLYKGIVRSSYRALLKHFAQNNEHEKVFRCLAALREEKAIVFGSEPAESLETATECLRERGKELGRKLCIVIAESIDSDTMLIGMIRSWQDGLAYFLSHSFSEEASQLYRAFTTYLFEDVKDRSYETIQLLGRKAWEALPQPLNEIFVVSDGLDVLISADSYWTAFPWEALRPHFDETEEWLGHYQNLARWSPITATGLRGLVSNELGNGAGVAAVICPWDALPEKLTSSQREAMQVSEFLSKKRFKIIGENDFIGQTATKAALLHALSLEPTIIHYSGHGCIQYNGEEVLVVADGVFGKQNLLAYKKQQGIAGQLFRQYPLVVLNSCYTGTARDFGGRKEDFAAALIDEGAAAVIASSSPIPDIIGGIMGTALYSGLMLNHETIADIFMRCRNQLELDCLHYNSKWILAWMLWRIHGNPYAKFA
nr:CHAT domain-containing protein [uncultured Desulfobacter sp.]